MTACFAQQADPVAVDPDEGASGGKADDGSVGIPDVRCEGTPDAGPKGKFRHFKSKLIANLGDAAHRGFDLVAPASAGTQRVEGWLSYGLADKALEDEDVDLFACRAGEWQPLGRVTTDDEGKFSLALADGDRLPVGMRDLYASVVGDRTGTEFLGYVAPDGTQLAVSDVDGTLTSSENAYFETIALGIECDVQPGAPEAYQRATAQGLQLVYVTARGSKNTDTTRAWLDHKGFPRGPVRLAPGFVTLPGSATVDYKTSTVQALEDGLDVVAGVGNRASDVTAYTAAGVAPDHIFIKLPEFADELADDLASGAAVGFDSYDDLVIP